MPGSPSSQVSSTGKRLRFPPEIAHCLDVELVGLTCAIQRAEDITDELIEWQFVRSQQIYMSLLWDLHQ